MKAVLIALPLFVLLTVVAGCTGPNRQPDCHGPWTAINPILQTGPHD